MCACQVTRDYCYEFHLWIFNSMMSKQNSNSYFFPDRQVRDHTVIYCLLLHICKSSSLPALMTVCFIDTSKRKTFFFFYTSLLMLFYTLGVSIYRLNILFYFSSLQTSAASIVFLLDIYTISLYSSHILLTFLSLNLVKRTLIEL